MQPLLAYSLAAILAIAVVGDLRARRIPNWLSLGGIGVGIALQTTLQGGDGAWNALLGTLTGGALLFPLWLLRGMAAGDVKLMAAVGAHLGPPLAVVAGLATLIAGALLACAALYRRRSIVTAMPGASQRVRTFAYAPAIAAGGALAAALPLWSGLVFR